MSRACLLLLFLLMPLTLAAQEPTKITLIHIGDLHGHLVPRPNMREGEGKEDKGILVGGLAYVYDQIEKIRAEHPHNLLINTGDTIQGGAEALYSSGSAMVDILNEWKIDAFVSGNWDFLYGTERFITLFANPTKQPAQANWGALAANLYYSTLYHFPETPYATKAGTRVLPPFVIKKINSLNVGIVGLTADRGPQAVSTRVMDGFFLTTGEEELQAAIKHFKKNKVDLSILISERGLAANLELVETYSGIDIVLSSDMHEETHQIIRAKTGTILVEEGQDGTLVGELNLDIKDKKIIDYQWQAHRISTKNNKAHPKVTAQINAIRKRFIKGHDFVSHVNPINGAVLRTPIDSVIGHTKTPLHRSNFSHTKSPAVIEGSSHNFLADAFKFACDADVGVIRGFRYGTHIAPGPIKLEDIYHYIPIGPQIACGLVSGDQIREQIKRSTSGSLSRFIGYWGGGWLTAYSGVSYDLDPYNEFGHRASNIRINGDPIDLEKMYSIAGYWYLENPNWINREKARQLRVLKNSTGGIVDATEVVAYYLQTLPTKTVAPKTGRINVLKVLPPTLSTNQEIQPLKGMPRPNY